LDFILNLKTRTGPHVIASLHPLAHDARCHRCCLLVDCLPLLLPVRSQLRAHEALRLPQPPLPSSRLHAPPAPLPSCLPPPTITTCMHSMHSGATGGLNMPLSFHSTVWAPVLLLVFQPTRAFPPAITSTLGPSPPRRAPALTKAEKWCVQTPCSLWFSLLQLGRRDPREFPLFPIQGEQCHQQPFPRFSVVR
jgi:hypothetical protein